MRTAGDDRFEALLESAPDGILLVDHDGRIDLVNERVEALFGYGRDELLGQEVETLIPEYARGRHVRHRRRYAAAPHTRSMGAALQLEGQRRDGSRFPVEVSLSPLVEADARPLVITIVRDVTEHRQHETRRLDLTRSEAARAAADAESARLRAVQSLFDEALERLPSTDRMLAAALERVCATLGGEAAAVLEPGPDGSGLVVRAETGMRSPAPDHAYRPEHLAGATHGLVVEDPTDGASPLAREARLRCLVGAPLESGGRARGVVHVGSGVPGRFGPADVALLARFAERIALALEQARLFDAERTATSAALAAEARLREMLTDLEAVVWEAEGVDRGRFRFISDGAEALFGRPVAEWTARDGVWAEVIDPDDRAVVLERSVRGAESGRQYDLEYRIVAPGRPTVWVRERVRPIHDDDGTVRLRGVSVEITQQRELEGRLLQAQKMQAVGQLAGGVAHDFNNLLTVIIGFTAMLTARTEGEQDLADLSEVQRAAERAQALTGQLLSFSRRHPQHTGLVDLNETVAGLEPMMRRLIDEDIALTLRLARDSVLVEADPVQIEQVVVNLVVNARDAMPQGGSVRITVEEQAIAEERARTLGIAAGSWAVLAVSDTGEGMSPEVRERVFEPFFTTKEPGSGTGLGLATVYGIVDRSGGTIAIESEEGRGTDFAVLLPVTHERLDGGADPADDASGEEPETGPRVLVVEDEAAVRLLVRRVLEGDGWTVLEAANGEAALRLVESGTADVDLLITDVVMPEMSGPELVSRIAASLPELPVIFTSGYTDSRLAGRRFDEETTELLRKPFRPADLRERARAAVEHDGAR